MVYVVKSTLQKPRNVTVDVCELHGSIVRSRWDTGGSPVPYRFVKPVEMKSVGNGRSTVIRHCSTCWKTHSRVATSSIVQNCGVSYIDTRGNTPIKSGSKRLVNRNEWHLSNIDDTTPKSGVPLSSSRSCVHQEYNIERRYPDINRTYMSGDGWGSCFCLSTGTRCQTTEDTNWENRCETRCPCIFPVTPPKNRKT